MLCSHRRRSLEEGKRSASAVVGAWQMDQPGTQPLTHSHPHHPEGPPQAGCQTPTPGTRGEAPRMLAGEHLCWQRGTASSASRLPTMMVLMRGADRHGGYHEQHATHMDPSPFWDCGEHCACALSAVPVTAAVPTAPPNHRSHILRWDVGDGCPAKVGGIVSCRGREVGGYRNPVQCVHACRLSSSGLCSLLFHLSGPHQAPAALKLLAFCVPLSHS